MPTEYRVLGTIKSITGNTLTTLYTVPAGKQAVISSILIGGANTLSHATSAVTYGICISQAGATQTAAQYIAMNNSFVVGSLLPTGSNDSFAPGYSECGVVAIVAGLTLSATDAILVSASTENITFHCFGSQIVP